MYLEYDLVLPFILGLPLLTLSVANDSVVGYAVSHAQIKLTPLLQVIVSPPNCSPPGGRG